MGCLSNPPHRHCPRINGRADGSIELWPAPEPSLKSAAPIELFSSLFSRPFSPSIGNFGNQAEIHIAGGQCGMGGNESRISAHHLHKADAIGSASNFDVGGSHG